MPVTETHAVGTVPSFVNMGMLPRQGGSLVVLVASRRWPGGTRARAPLGRAARPGIGAVGCPVPLVPRWHVKKLMARSCGPGAASNLRVPAAQTARNGVQTVSGKNFEELVVTSGCPSAGCWPPASLRPSPARRGASPAVPAHRGTPRRWVAGRQCDCGQAAGAPQASRRIVLPRRVLGTSLLVLRLTSLRALAPSA